MQQVFYIDFLTLMLVNMAGAFVVGAFYCFAGFGKNNPSWAVPLLSAGIIATVCGFYIIFRYPLPGPFNIAYGELSVLLGVLLLGGSLALAKGWSLGPLALYAWFAGLSSVVVGAAFIYYGLASGPILAGAGFICTGLAGMSLGPAVWFKPFKFFRWPTGLFLLAAAVIWLMIGLGAYWMHLEKYKNFQPFGY